jgi:hypothetical protein
VVELVVCNEKGGQQLVARTAYTVERGHVGQQAGLPNVEFVRNAKLLHEVLGANDKMWTELELSLMSAKMERLRWRALRRFRFGQGLQRV